ncbi:MAG: TIM barrel protein [Opitutaceae bacterium]
MHAFSRRDFIKLSAAAGLAATLPIRALAGAGPFGRAGSRARLKLSLAAYSFRENFPIMRGKPNTKVPPGRETDMFKFIDYCAAQGCAGAELTSYFFAEETDAYMIQLRRHAFLRGVEVSGTAIGNNFSMPKGPKLAEEIATTKKWIDRAHLLGAQHIRVFAGNIPKDAPKDFTRAVADKVVIGALEECCDYAGKKGVFLGLENHDSIGTAAALIPMVKAVNSPWCGINLDSGNFHSADPYRDFAECVPFALNVQFKVEIDGASAKEKKPADMKRFTQILRDGGYQGWVALEYEAKEDSATAVPRYLNEMKALLSG